MGHSAYLSRLFDIDDFVKVVKAIAESIKKDKIKAVAARGVSGITVAAAISFRCKVPMIIVRKPDEHSHACYKVEYNQPIKDENIAIIDDLISTGATLKAIREALHMEGMKATHLYLYQDTDAPRKSMEGLIVRSFL